MMKNKRLIALLLCGMLLLSCVGCQLAKPDGEAAGEDRLIGAFVTWEYLDLFDFVSYFNDHKNTLTDGAVISPTETAAYQGRIYATAVPRSDGSTDDFVFDGLEGAGIYSYEYEDAAGVYTACHIDAGLVSNGAHYFVSDEGERVELEGTVYFLSSTTREFYFNPVYQTADGQIYVTSGQGYLNSGSVGEGEIFSTTFDETTTVTENGQSQSMGCKVTVHVAVMLEPTQIVVIQMDEESHEISRQPYDPGSMPETLTLDPVCAYVIAETHKLDGDGQEIITRELVNLTDDADYLTTFYAREDGVCVQQDTELIFPG